jgi:hypothetical protein
MSYSISYFQAKVKAEIESRPDGILADYARIVCQENTGHARARTEDSPQKAKGGTEWLN